MRAEVCYNGCMEGVSVKAFAKINLSLDITGSRGGYHMIDSVVASIDLCDDICAVPRADGKVTVEMRGMGGETIPREENNAVIAAEKYVSLFKTRGADISIQKRIPMGAGLGGSSADAAGVLNALFELYGAGDRAALKQIADEVGSDCGYMLDGGYARITGRGERIAPLDCKTEFYLIIAVAEGGVPTGKCYALSNAYPEKRRTSNALCRAICAGQCRDIGGLLSNGLYPAAAVINPRIRDAMADLSLPGALGVNMTGSGSGVYALFGDESSRDGALKAYRGAHPAFAARTLINKR